MTPSAKSPLAALKSPLPGGASLKRPHLTAFLCSLCVAAAFILPFVLRRGGVLYITDDQITQLIPFTQAMARNLQSGRWLYAFELDLGAGMIEGYSYYGLCSPFSLLFYLLPWQWTPYLLGPQLMLKFACAGLFACMWLRRHTETDLAALMGSMLYAFCGFAIANMVFPFGDTAALFPLVLLGMDLAMEHKAHGLLAVAVAVNILANPTLFFGTAVFMVLYFAAGLCWRRWRLTLKSFGRMAAEAACGVALTGAVLLPFVVALAANPRVGGTLPFGAGWFFSISYRYFELLRALVLPAEVIHANSMMVLADAASPELYLPLFGLVPVFAYALSVKKDWLRGLLLCSLVCLAVPVLNSAFGGFNATYYTRWLYAPALAAALACARVAERPAIPLRRGYAAWAACAALFCGCMALWRFYYGYDYVVTYLPAFIANLALCAAGLAATAATRRVWAAAPRVLAAGVGVFAVACGALNLLISQGLATMAYGKLTNLPARTFAAAESALLPEGVYRTNAPVANQYFGHGSPFSFTSTVPAGVFELQAAFGRQRTSASRIAFDEPGLWSLLGVKYLLSTGGAEAGLLPNVVPCARGEKYQILENEDALPLVIGFDAAIADDDAQVLGNTQKSVALLHGVVLNDAPPQPALPRLAASALDTLDYAGGVAARQAMAATAVRQDADGITARLNMPAGGAVLVTLPYSSGWRCEIDGVETALVKADWGLMAAACPAGAHEIVLRYLPPGLAAGAELSVLGLLGLAALLVFKRWPQMKKAARRKPGSQPHS